MRFSVIIPTYNRRHLLAAAIASALQDRPGDTEVVVVDDGSTDGTLEWLANTFRDAPVRGLRNQRGKGPGGARNTGILAARGERVALLDSDDAFLPGHLDAADALLAGDDSIGVVFGRARYERDGRPVDYMGPNFERKLAKAPTLRSDATASCFDDTFFDHLLEQGCWFNLSSVVMRRAAALQLMREDLRVAEDYEFWVRLARTHRFACLHAPQIRYALGSDNISFENADTAAKHAPELMRAYEIILGYPGLTAPQLRTMHDKLAQELFDWGYRLRQRGQAREAAARHMQSMRHGLVGANVVAMLKLPIAAALQQR